jgi:hypothetical protein
MSAYHLRWKRRNLLWRALRSPTRLTVVNDRTSTIRPGMVLCFGSIRNEAMRLPYFLEHHRKLGVGHFLFVDNASKDGSPDMLARQPDVSFWSTADSYKAAHFGLDWVNWLLRRHGAGHWCLTLDADELLIYPQWQDRGLTELTMWLDAQQSNAMACIMLELYPKGPLSQAVHQSGQDPVQTLPWFDADGYDRTAMDRFGHVSIRGGVRRRVFFADNPDLAPHLHKTPLIRWKRGYAYLSSTHIALPRALNGGFSRPDLPTGVLLHTKFLPNILDKSKEEKQRGEHFTHAARYDGYYDSLIADPDLWHDGAVQYQGWQHLEVLGLMARGRWGS